MSDSNEHRSQYRLPLSVHQKLVASAKKNGRSVNAEVVHRLGASFDHDERQDLIHRFNNLSTQVLQQQKREAELLAALLDILTCELQKSEGYSNETLQRLRLLIAKHFTQL
jgi:hypothetical protein